MPSKEKSSFLWVILHERKFSFVLLTLSTDVSSLCCCFTSGASCEMPSSTYVWLQNVHKLHTFNLFKFDRFMEQSLVMQKLAWCTWFAESKYGFPWRRHVAVLLPHLTSIFNHVEAACRWRVVSGQTGLQQANQILNEEPVSVKVNIHQL